jgi:hypothetical protein
VIFIWIEDVFDTNGAVIDWTWETAFVSQLCSRGVSDTESTLCI